MLRKLTDLRGFDIHARDGDVGDVDDFLFDDREWVLRYMVVDTGTWMPGRRVLIGPEAIGGIEWDDGTLRLDLSKEQLRRSPDVSTNRPVSVREEEVLRGHYGWPTYWSGFGLGLSGVAAPPMAPTSEGAATKAGGGHSHLRSMNEVTGYHIRASDGEIGHIDDMPVEEGSWAIRYLILDTRNWLPGRKVLVAPGWVESISWAERIASVGMTREQVKNSPDYDPDKPVGRAQEEALFTHHERKPYWDGR